ncbi:uncharacterized protein LOC129912630 [Episyrphus balteatus]|uniref:uncharacterized protein LOC129912630 n=1 Tax=Episyrphus balteatus TaxID=286459 RepID=UPI0024865CE4|nr:uncharacterized protein LOC129912630 [Episyrphus balteatus]
MADNAMRDREANARAVLNRYNEVKNEIVVAEMPKAALVSRNRQLSNDFKDFKRAHKILIRSIPPEELESAMIYFEEISQAYFMSSTIINTALENKSTPSIISNDAGIIRVETARAPDPGEFNGNPSNWPSFRDQFKAEVHDRHQLDDVTKLHLLKKACVGTAKLTVGSWQPLAVNYKKAWESLENKYEDPYRLEQALVSDLLKLSSLRDESHEGLRQIIDTTSNTLRQLEAMHVPVQHWDTFVIGLILCRLPRNVADAWEQKRIVANKPNLADLMAFLEGRARGRIYIEQGSSPNRINQWTASSPVITKNHTTKNLMDQSGQPKSSFVSKFNAPCSICSGLHAPYRCPGFLSKITSERLAKIKELRLCTSCLKKHEGICPMPRCPLCGGTHNSLLCLKGPDRETRVKGSKQITASCIKNHNELQCIQKHNPFKCESPNGLVNQLNFPSKTAKFNLTPAIKLELALLPTAAFQLFTRSGASGSVRALCDTGAQVNLITKKCVQKIGLCVQVIPTNISGLGKNSQLKTHGVVFADLWSRGLKKLGVTIQMIVVSKLMSKLPVNELPANSAVEFLASDLADPEFNLPGRIDVLLGAGAMAEIMTKDVKRLKNGLIAQETQLGWIIYGNSTTSSSPSVYTTLSVPDTKGLEAAIRRLWEIDQLDEPVGMTPDEKWCEEHFHKTVKRDEFGRYIVTIPIKPNKQNLLGLSRDMAMRRFHALERQFAKDPVFAEWYIEYMRDLLKAGFIQEAAYPIDETKPHAYIPHHGVRPPKKPRVVFDASAATSTGWSFNDIQLPGPRLQGDLYDIIIRFRIGKIAMSADVKKMFPQVKIAEHQWDMQRIFWRENINDPLREYQLPRVTFGMTSSTYNAVKSMQRCVDDYREELPLAHEAVYNSFYVDDFLKSVHTTEKAIATREQLETSLGRGCFPLTKWASNEPAMLLENERIQFKSLEEESSTSVLGLLWNPENDTLGFKIRHFNESETITKRIIASEGARIYDPNGYLAPVTMRAKLFIQKLWTVGANWDEKVNDDISEAWKVYRASISTLTEVKIPRWVGISPDNELQLHTFCDASNIAYGAVVYVRVKQPDGTIVVNVLTSKNKLAPKQTKTIPRLELCAAAMGAVLTKKVAKILQVQNENLHYWSDSEIVLYWLRKFPGDTKVFVGNRISLIQEHSDVERWKHVPSKENPGDLISRGVISTDLINCSLWWHGPGFLMKSQDNWPQSKLLNLPLKEKIEADGELRKNKVFSAPIMVLTLTSQSGQGCLEIQDLLDYHSSMNKVLRITAYVQRFVRLFCKKWLKVNKIELAEVLHVRKKRTRDEQENQNPAKRRKTLPKSQSELVKEQSEIKKLVEKVPVVTPEEYSGALAFWIKHTQKKEYPLEHHRLLKAKPLPNDSDLLSLTPFMDTDGIIRLGGRISRAELTFHQKHPILLPAKCILSHRLMQQAHAETQHGGLQLCMQYLRDKYWVTNLRTSMRKLIHKCVVCTRYRQKVSNQLMADLPAARVQISRPFTHCGVDFAGPYRIRAYTGRGVPVSSNAYLCLFIDFPTKAVHLELVSDLSSKAFLAALDRLVARRGMVSHIYSDNGTNFVGANSELKRIEEQLRKNDLQDEVAKRRITWHFNTPLAPHHGGLWEASVKRAKYHLNREIGSRSFTFEELYTAFVRIELCLNSRPLCALKDDPNDLTALTPGHFLTGGQLIRPLGPDVKEIASHRLDSWDKIHQFEQSIWSRWSQDYLSELQLRTKWKLPNRNLQVGDLVFLKEENQPPGVWKRARIIKVYADKDGLVRSARIRAGGRMYDRPVNKLCLIPIEDSLQPHNEMCANGKCTEGCTLSSDEGHKVSKLLHP